MAVLGELRKEVLLEYPEVEVSDPTGLGGSVGLAMWPTDHNLGTEVMIREAWLLNAAAQTGLATVHRMSAGGAVEPDALAVQPGCEPPIRKSRPFASAGPDSRHRWPDFGQNFCLILEYLR